MIRVNLVGAGRKKAKAGARIALPATFTPILLIFIALGFAAAGYVWYSNLNNQVADLNARIKQAQAQKAAPDKVIQADTIYQARKKDLENRVKVIENLQKNQVSPVLALDQLSEAVDRTRFVWLSN